MSKAVAAICGKTYNKIMPSFSPPRYNVTNSVIAHLGRIEAAKEIIENSPLIPRYERQFKSEAEARTVHFATSLEGNALNLTEVKRIIEGMPSEVTGSKAEAKSEESDIRGQASDVNGQLSGGVVARERDVQEVINYRNAMAYMDQVQKEGTAIISNEVISNLNKIITKNIIADEESGKYRAVGAYSRNSLTWEKALEWPEPERIEALMDQLTSWLESAEGRELNPILRSGILHTWLVLIHPFEDGNGRTARAASTLSLFLDGYNVKNLFSLEEYYDRDAQQYYAGIKSILDSGGDYTLWLDYFCQGLSIEYNRVKERVIKLSKDFKVREAVGQIAISERQEKIIDHLQNFGRLANAEFGRLFPEISEDTVLREISDLIKKEILIKRGKTKSARYELK